MGYGVAFIEHHHRALGVWLRVQGPTALGCTGPPAPARDRDWHQRGQLAAPAPVGTRCRQVALETGSGPASAAGASPVPPPGRDRAQVLGEALPPRRVWEPAPGRISPFATWPLRPSPSKTCPSRPQECSHPTATPLPPRQKGRAGMCRCGNPKLLKCSCDAQAVLQLGMQHPK